MSKVTLMLDAAVAVIIDIRSLADSLQALAEAVSEGSTEEKLPAKKTAPKKKQTEESKPEPGKKVAHSGRCQSHGADKSRKGFTADVKAILTKHGADKLSEVNPAEYKALLAEVKVLGNAG